MSKTEDLGRAHGYRVDTHDGRIGGVAAVLPRAGRGRTGVLLVRSGLLSCKLVAVAFDSVEHVDQDARRVLLRELPDTMRERSPSRARRRIVARA
jgi:hypothetical protein